MGWIQCVNPRETLCGYNLMNFYTKLKYQIDQQQGRIRICRGGLKPGKLLGTATEFKPLRNQCKVIFSEAKRVSRILSMGEVSAPLHAGIPTFPPPKGTRGRPPRTRGRQPPPPGLEADTPLDQRQKPPDQRQTPPVPEVDTPPPQCMLGRYASYWNAYLFWQISQGINREKRLFPAERRNALVNFTKS